MVDIYDELGFIKDVLANGLSQKWERDARLLVRYYKMEGMKKAEVKKTILQKCNEAASRENNRITFDRVRDYKRVSKVIDTAWKAKEEIRTIHGIAITKDVLEWFLHLETDMYLTDEQVEYYKKRRPGISIKNNNPMNMNRVKFLFTLYIWARIQSYYEDVPNLVYIKSCQKRFKEDANLPASFSLKKERDFLLDLGLININHKLGINVNFIDDYDAFKVPLTEENTIMITTGEPGEGDLYNPGYWLEKQKLGTFTCQHCGKEFLHYNNTPREKARKYCKECAKKEKNHNPVEQEKPPVQGQRYCSVCGNAYKLSSELDIKSTRCPECQKQHARELKKLQNKRYRDKVNQVNLFVDNEEINYEG